MKLSTRLLLVLVPATALVMAGYAAWSLNEREASVTTQARIEMEAYATALALALEDLQPSTVKSVFNDLTRSPRIYAVLVYDAQGRLLIASDPVPTPAPPAVLHAVIGDRDSVTFRREMEAEDVYSIIRPVTDRRGVLTGALEVARPLSTLRAERATIRERYLLNILTLAALTTVVTLWIVGRVVDRPLSRLTDAVRAIGHGELTRRVTAVPRAGQLYQLAVEFNAMAERLEAARGRLEAEANARVALERRLRQTQKVATIGNLAAGLAHEVAGPLNVISGRTEQLLKQDPEPEQRTRTMRTIMRQIERITQTVQRLLDFGRRREPQLHAVDAGAILDSVAELLEGELARVGIELIREDHRPLWVMGDGDQLHQVFVNLVLNAIQALEGAEGPRRIVVRAQRRNESDGKSVTIDIADSGPGISPDVRAQLFEPFVTTKSRGTGLGLAVAHSIVEEHGGTLEAASGPEGGAVFRVGLRAARPFADDHDA